MIDYCDSIKLVVEHWSTKFRILTAMDATVSGFHLSTQKAFMRQLALLCITVILLAGCRKEQGSRVDIYLLKSFNSGIDTTQRPVVNIITNAVLDDTPLIANEDIRFYTRENCTFTLRKNIQAVIQNYGPDKAFAVSVNDEAVYYGRFHPMYMSSLVYGLATINPLFPNNNELRIDFINLGGTNIDPLDKRNDTRIINALKETRRVR